MFPADVTKMTVRATILAVAFLPASAMAAEGGARTIRLPASDGHARHVQSYVERDPVPEYRHASEAAHEAFRDIKYGVRIHWGVYTILRMGGRKGEASWPLAEWMPFEEKQRYQGFYKTWNPQGFDAGEWMDFFARNGLKMFAFTAKHADGFSMFDTKTRVKRRVHWTAPGGPKIEECDLAYSIMETPFGRDVVKELCDAARKRGIKIDLYFCHPDWYDADFRPYNYHPAQTPGARADPARYGNAPARGPHAVLPDPTPEETERMVQRHRAQLKELLTNYGKIDMICLDQWMGPDVWPAMRETMLQLRAIQPDVMFRARGIGNYGDFYTPEGFVPGSPANTGMPWFVIYPLARTFAYDPDAKQYKGGPWILSNLIDSVAKGGAFMVAIGPDADGKFHPAAVEQLQYVGRWLDVNGEAIYATRPREGDLWKEDNDVRYTRSKDHNRVYAISLKWPGERLVLKSVRPREGAKITMLGVADPLAWRMTDGGLVIDLPGRLQDEANRPCKQAYALKIERCPAADNRDGDLP